MKTLKLTIVDKDGLHARPASDICKAAGKFSSKVELSYKGKTINLKSVLMLLSLAIPMGSDIEIKVEGPDEDLAMEKVHQVFIDSQLV